MKNNQHKIPLLLKLKWFKNSKLIRSINKKLSLIKPSRNLIGTPKRMLIFRNDRIGDAMVTLPVLRDIRLNYPEIEIDVVVSSANKFVFDDIKYINQTIVADINGYETGILYKLPIFGGFILFMKHIVLPWMGNSNFRKVIRKMKQRNYDYAADLIGLKRNSILAAITSKFTAGPGRLLPFLFYDNYSGNNWVTSEDNDFMTRKIEQFLTQSANLKLCKRDFSLPLTVFNFDDKAVNDKYDIIFHFGTSILRKLSYHKEKELVSHFSDRKLLITDSGDNITFNELRKEFGCVDNVTFKLFSSLPELANICKYSKLLFCYDGGQSHYLSQFIRTFTIFGPGSIALWKPYEFTDYIHYSSGSNGEIAIRSRGQFGHAAIYKPVFCSPCFDTGCRSKPCLNQIDARFIINVMEQLYSD